MNLSGNLAHLMESEGVRKTLHRITVGLHAPPDSGERRQARFLLVRLFGPGSIAFIIGALLVTLLFCYVVITPPAEDEDGNRIFVTMRDKDDTPLPDALPALITPAAEPMVAKDQVAGSGLPIQDPAGGAAGMTPAIDIDLNRSSDLQTAGTSEYNPIPATARLNVRERGRLANLPSIMTERVVPKADTPSERAVIRALGWLKTHQNEDGSWGPEKVACTGFALLTFLAHGDMPAISTNYGACVERGLKYLLQEQKSNGMFSQNAYSHGIASYAVCEAYAMTRIVSLRSPMERAIKVIIDGQGERGGYDYSYKKGDRWDMSVSGWQFQALKAAKLAGSDNDGLDEAIKKAGMFLRDWTFAPIGADKGGWGYAGTNIKPGGQGVTPSMTSVGLLALQLHGDAGTRQVRRAVAWLDDTQQFSWPREGRIPLYNYYYQTQARFQQGGQFWKKWDDRCSSTLITEQKSDGHWEGGDHESSGGLVYTTCMCALILEVYYRYLPTTQRVEARAPAPATIASDEFRIRVL